MKLKPVFVEPFDPAGHSLGARRRALRLHQRQISELQSLLRPAIAAGFDEGIFRSLEYRLECLLKEEQRDIERDEAVELKRLAGARA